MDAKVKNWIVYGFQLEFFITLATITIFIEFSWAIEVVLKPNFRYSYPPPKDLQLSIQETIFSVSFVTILLLNLTMVTFSMYAFIFFLHVLDSNPAKTAPVCAFAIDFALINLFFYHFSIYKERYFTYFAPHFPISIYFHIPNLIIQISEILIIISLLTIFLNLRFGIQGIIKHIQGILTNKMTDMIHILLLTNGVQAIYFLYTYTIILPINFTGFIFSLIFALSIFVFFLIILHKYDIGYPIEAIQRMSQGMKFTKNGKEEKNKCKN